MEFLINGSRTEASILEALVKDEQMMTTWSAWHCQIRCQDDPECKLFSWRHSITEEQNQDGQLGQCILMRGLNDTYDVMSTLIAQQGWLSSGRDQETYFAHFESNRNQSTFLSL